MVPYSCHAYAKLVIDEGEIKLFGLNESLAADHMLTRVAIYNVPGDALLNATAQHHLRPK